MGEVVCYQVMPVSVLMNVQTEESLGWHPEVGNSELTILTLWLCKLLLSLIYLLMHNYVASILQD